MDSAFTPIFHQFLNFLLMTCRPGGPADLFSIDPQHGAQIVAPTDGAGILGGFTVVTPGSHQEEVSVTDCISGHQTIPELAERMPAGPLVTDLISIIHHTRKCRRGHGGGSDKRLTPGRDIRGITMEISLSSSPLSQDKRDHILNLLFFCEGTEGFQGEHVSGAKQIF